MGLGGRRAALGAHGIPIGSGLAADLGIEREAERGEALRGLSALGLRPDSGGEKRRRCAAVVASAPMGVSLTRTCQCQATDARGNICGQFYDPKYAGRCACGALNWAETVVAAPRAPARRRARGAQSPAPAVPPRATEADEEEAWERSRERGPCASCGQPEQLHEAPGRGGPACDAYEPRFAARPGGLLDRPRMAARQAGAPGSASSAPTTPTSCGHRVRHGPLDSGRRLRAREDPRHPRQCWRGQEHPRRPGRIRHRGQARVSALVARRRPEQHEPGAPVVRAGAVRSA